MTANFKSYLRARSGAPASNWVRQAPLWLFLALVAFLLAPLPSLSDEHGTGSQPPGQSPGTAAADGSASTAKKSGQKEGKVKGKAFSEAPCLSWVDPLVPPKAALLCVHGLGLYSGSWAAFGKRMSSLGYPVYAIDVRGFGSWMEAKGHKKVDFTDCLTDVQNTLTAVRRANPGLPVFLVGESMGGAIALRATALYPDLLTGLISAVPAGERFQQKRTDLKVALHMLEGPNRPFNIGTKIIDQATDKPGLREAWEDDPLDRMKLSPRELLQFQRFMNENHDSAKAITDRPVLLLQGCKDRLVKPEGTVELFNELATPDKDLILVASAEHLMLEKKQFTPELISTLANWIDSHMPHHAAESSPQAILLMAQGEEHLSAGEIKPAIKALENAVQDSPQSSEAHYLLGRAYAQSKDYPSANQHLRQAVALSTGDNHGRRANRLLLGLPPQAVAPRTGPSTRPFLRLLESRALKRHVAEPGDRMPSVLVFCAPWCEPCKELDPIVDKVKSMFANQVDFVTINVNDKANQELVEQYNVGPIPTMVFLKPDGEVASYSIGYSGIAAVARGIRGILQ